MTIQSKILDSWASNPNIEHNTHTLKDALKDCFEVLHLKKEIDYGVGPAQKRAELAEILKKYDLE